MTPNLSARVREHLRDSTHCEHIAVGRIIGCGDVAEHKSGPPLYQTPRSELIVVMRRDKAKAPDFARRHGANRSYADPDSLLAAPEVNAVYVASPHHLHPAHAIQASQAGKIVLCEKPMGTSSADARSIVDACKTNEVSLTLAYYCRFWPITQKMKQLLAEDAIRRVVQARVQLSAPFSGDPERPWLTPLEEAGGGALANAGSHWVDLLRYLLGEFEEVTAFCSSAAGGFEVEDTVLILLSTADGALASLATTWQGGVGVDDFDVTGTRGRFLASPLSAGRLYLHR